MKCQRRSTVVVPPSHLMCCLVRCHRYGSPARSTDCRKIDTRSGTEMWKCPSSGGPQRFPPLRPQSVFRRFFSVRLAGPAVPVGFPGCGYICSRRPCGRFLCWRFYACHSGGATRHVLARRLLARRVAKWSSHGQRWCPQGQSRCCFGGIFLGMEETKRSSS